MPFKRMGYIAAAIFLIAAPASGIGPTLHSNPADLDRAVRCPPTFSGAHEPVLFVHGTAGRPEDHWALGYSKILPDLGFDVCTVRLPDLALGDIQVAAEYVVHAVRAIAARSGKKVDVIGYSQGGLEPRWAIKYWPDVQASVDDLVTLATPHHGAIVTDVMCLATCQAAVWQMGYLGPSNFVKALNAGDETPGAIDYTSIYSLTDDLVQPALPTATAALVGASNIAIQDICPGRPVAHGLEPFDAAVFALVIDALTHPGAADPARIDTLSVCTQLFLPGLTPDDAVIAQEVVYANGLESVALMGQKVPSEPPVQEYAHALPEPSLVIGLGTGIALLILAALVGRTGPMGVIRRNTTPRLFVLAAVSIGLTLAAHRASADGPALETDQATLDRAIQCPIAFSGDHEPILLVHGTAGRPEDHWALGYQKVLPDMGFDVCTVRLPNFALTDIQTSAEYVVNAVRVIAAASGKKVDMIGYSQGGLEPRWAVKYWPDVQASVDDLVTLATPHHGTLLGDIDCVSGMCPPAVWQMRPSAFFINALNAGDETPGAIDYTSIYSIHDELVQPVLPTPTATLAGGTTIMIQDVCPGRPVNHGGEPLDAAVFALVLDALTHAGPADPSRIDLVSVCTQAFLPGLTPDDAAAAQAVIYGNGGETIAFGPNVDAEPPLRDYVTAVAATGLFLLLFAIRRRS